MAQDLKQVLDYTNPEFIRKYAGKIIYDRDSDKHYYVENNGYLTYLPRDSKGALPAPYTNTYNFGEVEYSDSSGLVGGSGFMKDQFKFVGDTSGKQAAADNNFGMGKTIPADQYTGETAGVTSGGATLYKLKDGTVTATPPSVESTDITQVAKPILAATAPAAPTPAPTPATPTYTAPTATPVTNQSNVEMPPAAPVYTPPAAIYNEPAVTPAPAEGTPYRAPADTYREPETTYRAPYNTGTPTPLAIGASQVEAPPQAPVATGPTAEQVEAQNNQIIQNILSGSGLSPYAQILAQQVIDTYPIDQAIDDERILNVFQQLSAQVVDPYWQDLIQTEMSDMQRHIAQAQASASASMSRIGASAASSRASAEISYQAKTMREEMEAKERVRQTFEGLETSGLMRTGRRLAELGTYGIAGEATVEGRIPEMNRKIAESSKAMYQADLASIGASSSASAAGVSAGLSNQIANYQWAAEQSVKALKQQQEKAKGNLLTDLITQNTAVNDYARLLI